MKRFAVSRLHLKEGQILKNQVVEVLDSGQIRFYPLQEELPHTEWLGGDFYVFDEYACGKNHGI